MPEEVKATAHRDHQRDISHCSACPKLCRHTCPAADAEKRETVTPWALMTTLYLRSKGQLAFTGADAEWVYHCTDCRACQNACKFGNDVPGALHVARAQLFAEGLAPDGAKEEAKNFVEYGGKPFSDENWHSMSSILSGARARSEARELVLVDCVTLAGYPEVVGDILFLLDHLGLKEVGLLSDADIQCCGLPLYNAGDLEGLKAHASRVRSSIGGRRRLMLTSPGCAHMMRDIYPLLGVEWDFEVGHIIDLITANLDRLPGGWKGGSILYHHPCHLARTLDRDEAPRAIIEKISGNPPREAFRTAKEALCCGGGGGAPAILPELSSQMAYNCLEKLAPKPEEILVTACSSCRRQLEKTAGAPVLDLISLLANHLREGNHS